jgi:HK97 family phage major capsid protein
MNRYELKKKSIEEAMREHVTTIQDMYKAAKDDSNRELTDEERLEVETHVKAIETLKGEKAEVDENIKTLERVDDIGRSLGPAVSVTSEPLDRQFEQWNRTMFPEAQKSLGEQFVDSKGYKSLMERAQSTGGLSGDWSTGQVTFDMKGTLLEGASSPGSGSGGGLLPVPQVVPGVVQTLFQRLTLADLVLSGQASGNTIRYIVEGTATSGAAGVAETGTKPESTLGLGTKDEPIKKIATLLPVSDEMLSDAPQIQSYINGRLMLFIKIEEERQLFRGTSGGNEVQGFLTSRNVPVYAGGTAAGNKAVQTFKALNSMRGSALIEPEWIVMHPTDWEGIRLLTDNQGQFFGGGPFQGPYGAGSNVQQSGQVTGANDAVWQKPVYVTAAVGGAGTALIGTAANAQIWRRGAISVEASNSHSTWFATDVVAIRAEERLGLAVYRPSAYLELRLS